MVLTVPETSDSLLDLEWVASLTDWAKADMIMFFWNLVNPSRKIDCSRPMDIMNEIQQRQAAIRLALVPSTVAALREVAAELI